MPTSLLTAPKISENAHVTALPGSQNTFPGTLPVLTLPGFPRRGILAEALRTQRSSSAARPQCRSLPPDASPEFRSGRLSKIAAAGRHIQPIAVCVCHAPQERQKTRLTSYGRDAALHGAENMQANFLSQSLSTCKDDVEYEEGEEKHLIAAIDIQEMSAIIEVEWRTKDRNDEVIM
ncbi:hypothetical protein NDU88_003643 [Pleurodeles waltl]|uniref:Uncharacterized protein n=1 Tax=Pleurodeles waltl TaxID=8319 RepID=A0AAV7LFW6_PLEWA|nr:hypothetical protein NDU88_003643 [Pleurodeles waltl]